MERLTFRAGLAEYDKQAGELFQGWRAGDRDAIQIFRTRHPRFLDEKIVWLPRNVAEEEIRSAPLALDDARLALARWYDFLDWPAVVHYANTAPTDPFEEGVEAVINGDAAWLRAHPELVQARSARINCFDPPVHGATLLHYIAANGVEGYRQKTPPNAVEIARTLLESGADPDALADMYGGQFTTMPMLVSSDPPAKAGVQVALVDLLADFGASVEPRGSGKWTSPLMTALAFGFRDAAEALVRRGARVETLAAAAGLGRIELARELLAKAGAEDRHRALALAAQLGDVEIVRLLLDAGEDPNRYNPKGNHAHSTPLHQAVWAGHEAVVRLLVERGARLDIQDAIYHSTPLGWAEYGGRKEIAQFLRGGVG